MSFAIAQCYCVCPCTAATEDQEDAASGVRTPSALILEPSRDLAQQTHDAFNSLKRHLTAPALQSVLLVGGTQPKEASRQLERGADIVTGTPGAAHTHFYSLSNKKPPAVLAKSINQ